MVLWDSDACPPVSHSPRQRVAHLCSTLCFQGGPKSPPARRQTCAGLHGTLECRVSLGLGSIVSGAERSHPHLPLCSGMHQVPLQEKALLIHSYGSGLYSKPLQMCHRCYHRVILSDKIELAFFFDP